MKTLLNGHVIDRQLMTRIEAIDLSNTRNRLIVKKGYSPDVVDQAIADYRKFLYVCIQFEGTHEPTEMVDEVWHDHILHTSQYMADCEAVAGRYIHHQPYAVEASADCENADSILTCVGSKEPVKAAECNGACGNVQCGTCSDTSNCASGLYQHAERPFVGNYRDLVPMGAVANKTCGESCGWCSNK